MKFATACVALLVAGFTVEAFNFGGLGAPQRPQAGATKVGLPKTKIVDDTTWTGPAVERRARAQAQTAKRNALKKKTQGEFSEKQMAALISARKAVPPANVGNQDQYWAKIAAKVPGQSADNCKRMASQMLFDKAAGTKSNFFKGYIDVIEPEMYVDESATAGKRFEGMLSGMFKQ